MPRTLAWEAPPGAPRLDRALADAFPELSRARLQALIAEGHVQVDGVRAKASVRPPNGARVTVHVPDDVVVDTLPEDIPLAMLHEDEHLLVLVKPAGMVVHPAAGHATGTLVNALLGRYGRLSSIGGTTRPGIVHRLDGGTSGVMVVARNDVAHRALSTMFAAHDLDRRYLAIVHRVPIHDNGVFESLLGRDPQNRLKVASVKVQAAPISDEPPRPIRIGEEEDEDEELVADPTPSRRGRFARTRWRTVARGDRVALVEAKLDTGRTHQVRVHLSEAGHPLLGDPLYGRRDCVAPAALRARVEALEGRPMLHAWHLGFRHPLTGEALAFTTPPPEDFTAMADAASLPLPSAVRAWA
ncbi:MAG: rRNA pseudouridines 1911, 1915, synthase [Pseudomonadota bacterium]|jgi:23S rRNA pseudouridine1911/1915/1917 synthase